VTSLIATAESIGLPSLAGWFKEIAAKQKAKRIERDTYNQLSRLTDRELNDMGIGRSDIMSIARGNFYRDVNESVEENKNLRGWV